MARVEIEVATHKGQQGWWKHVTDVEPKAKNGYGIEGEFLRQGFHDLPDGAVLLACEPVGSGRFDKRGRVYWITDVGLEALGEWHDWTKEFVFIRDELLAALNVDASVASLKWSQAKVTTTPMADGKVLLKVDQIVSERTAGQISAMLAREDANAGKEDIWDIAHLNHY